MLRYFIVQHIDAIITTFGGLFATYIGVKAAARGDASRRTKILKVLGPCLVLFGLLRFFIDSAVPIRVTTSDKVASAEFPGAPTENDQKQSIEGREVHVLGWVYSVPGKDISLRLSYSDVPPEETKIPPADRFSFAKQFFIKQGFNLMEEGEADFGGTKGYFAWGEHSEKKTRMWARIAYVGSRVYRLVAAAGPTFGNDPAIPKFLDSFQVLSTPPAPAP